MASMLKIKNRIRSVSSTQQITKAMNLVAASKLQKAKIQLINARPFFKETEAAIGRIVNNSKGMKHAFLEERPIKKTLVIVVTGDKGLCGGFNSNVSKEAKAIIDKDAEGAIISIGTKGRDFFVRRKKTVLKTFTGISEIPFYTDAAEIGEMALDLYKKGEYDKVYLVYTEFKSAISYLPKTLTLLPVDTSSFKDEDASKARTLMSYEPDEAEVLDYVIPKYVNTVIYGALVESAASQLAARMTSMDSATENAENMISSLTLQFNRARQSAITQEITEIVSGSNALE